MNKLIIITLLFSLLACQSGRSRRFIASKLYEYSIKGKVVDVETGSAPIATIHIKGDKIENIYLDQEVIPQSVPAPILDKLIIYPGLIDSHNHLKYNFFPLWDLEGKKYENRYQWAKNGIYKNGIKKIYSKLYLHPSECEGLSEDKLLVCLAKAKCKAVIYGEFKALAGGTTSMQGSVSFDSNGSDFSFRGISTFKEGSKSYLKDSLLDRCISGYMRNLERDSINGPNKIRTTAMPITSGIWEATAKKLNREQIEGSNKAFYVHISEGVDESSRQEFYTLKKLGLLTSKTIIIHGNGLDETEFIQMGKAKASLAWSPSSNLLLYGKTTNIPYALKHGVTISLGSDWSLSGTDNMLDELKVAKMVNQKVFNNTITDFELLQMATINGAKVAGLADVLGSIKKGKYADFLIFKDSDYEIIDPFSYIFKKNIEDIYGVFVSGIPQFGSNKILDKVDFLVNKYSLIIEDGCKRDIKFFNADGGHEYFEVKSYLDEKMDKTFSKLSTNLKEKLGDEFRRTQPLCSKSKLEYIFNLE